MTRLDRERAMVKVKPNRIRTGSVRIRTPNQTTSAFIQRMIRSELSPQPKAKKCPAVRTMMPPCKTN
jgi:hypothetical protein